MTTNEFKEYVKMRKALDTEKIHHFMDDMSNEARRITFRLNTRQPKLSCGFMGKALLLFFILQVLWRYAVPFTEGDRGPTKYDKAPGPKLYQTEERDARPHFTWVWAL